MQRKVTMLEGRLFLLEEENKKSTEAIKELSECIQTITLMTADLAGDVALLGSFIDSLAKSTTPEDDIVNKYLFSSDDDDGGGYLN
jgi:hypothetical protein